jgi:hypothetical protein
MKQSTANNASDIIKQIENIEKGIFSLKLSLLKNLVPTGKKTVKLKGVLKGVDVTEEDIRSVQKSLCSTLEI